MPRIENRGKVEKVKDFRGTLRRFVSLLAPHKITFILSFVFAFIGVLASALAPRYLGYVINEALLGLKTGAIDKGAVYRFLVIMLALYVITPFFRFWQHFIIAGVSGQVVADLRARLNARLDCLPLKFFDGTTQGDVMSRLTNDIDRIDENLQEGISQSVISVFTVLCIVAMMFSTDVVLTLVCVVTIPLMLFSVSGIIRFSQRYFVDNQKYLGDLDGHVEEVYSGHSVVKAFCREEAVISQFDDINGRLRESGWKSTFYGSMSHPVTGFWGNMGFILVSVVGALRAVAGVVTVGDIQAFVQYVRRFNMPIQELANFSSMFQSTLAAAERIFELLDEPEESPDGEYEGPSAEERSPGGLGDIDFDDVSFSYSPERPLIRHLSLHIPHGTKVAIVGPTGSGKTTLVNLLMRFYDVSSGEIRLDGVNINSWRRDALRERFGMVLQDTWLFNGTIEENIAYGAEAGDIARAFEAGGAEHDGVCAGGGVCAGSIVHASEAGEAERCGACPDGGADNGCGYAISAGDAARSRGAAPVSAGNGQAGRSRRRRGAERASASAASGSETLRKRVEDAARRACADHFINALPDGYSFVINEEGSNISQGEKQLITIARAFMSDPEILILDEATSNVDTRTESLVQKAMERLTSGRTSFIIAHRLSTIRDADRILVLDEGNIVEQGTHLELLEKGGFYSRLYRSQFLRSGQ